MSDQSQTGEKIVRFQLEGLIYIIAGAALAHSSITV